MGEYRPRYGKRESAPIEARRHFSGQPYATTRQRRSHESNCPWAAGGGQKTNYWEGPNWELPPDAYIRKLMPERELEAFLYPDLSRGLIRTALDAAEAGCVVLAIGESNWIASIFAGRWAYNVRVERGPDGRPARTDCDCLRESPCVHAVATWIVWAAGEVVSRPPRPVPKPPDPPPPQYQAPEPKARRRKSEPTADPLSEWMAQRMERSREQRREKLKLSGNSGYPWRPFIEQANQALVDQGFGLARCAYGWIVRSAREGGVDLIRVKRGTDGVLHARAVGLIPEASSDPVSPTAGSVDRALASLTGKRAKGLSDGPVLPDRIVVFVWAMLQIRAQRGDVVAKQ